MFAWFLFLVRGGLASWFDSDDLMNLYYYWSRPLSALLKANLFFWSSYYRPAGGLFYRIIFALWGFHPLPFHIAALILLSIDFGLLAVVVYQLTGSRWGALLALLVFGIHPTFSVAYFDTGAIYDVLAYAFFWGAFALYVRVRRTQRMPGWALAALLICLLAASLNSKEISVLLPVAVALYELLWHPPDAWKPAVLWRWTRREGRFAAIGAIFDAAYIAGKRLGPNSLWDIGPYRPHYSLASYADALAHFLRLLIYKPVTISSAQVAGLLAVMLAVALAARRRCLLWGIGFILAGVLPLAFIQPRGGFCYLAPSAGWAVYSSGLLAWLLERLAGSRVRLRRAMQAALFAALVAVLAPWQRTWIEMHARAAHDMQCRFLRYDNQLTALIRAPRKGARVLLLADADGRDDWDVSFLICLHYGDPSMQVERMTVYNDRHIRVDQSSYDYVLDWVGGRFVLAGRGARCAAGSYRCGKMS